MIKNYYYPCPHHISVVFVITVLSSWCWRSNNHELLLCLFLSPHPFSQLLVAYSRSSIFWKFQSTWYKLLLSDFSIIRLIAGGCSVECMLKFCYNFNRNEMERHEWYHLHALIYSPRLSVNNSCYPVSIHWCIHYNFRLVYIVQLGCTEDFLVVLHCVPDAKTCDVRFSDLH